MKLLETGGKRARLYFPSSIRDRYGLDGNAAIGIQIECDGDQPVAVLDPNGAEGASNLVRPVTVKANGQAQIDFPRQVAQAVGYLGSELELEDQEGRLLLRRITSGE
jgi:hypothetical protein